MVSSTKLRCAGDSHPGLARSNNEDRIHFDPDRGIFLVIDGIGGQAAGEKAADIAVNLVRSRLERQTGTAGERIREAITVANNEIFRLSRTNPEWRGMACVLTVAVAENGSAVVGHVGDSRLYKIQGGRIQKITHDHSPVGEREDNHDITEAEAMRHPRRNEVYRDVGSGEHTPDDPEFIELIRIPFEPDSALLLCSDGLSDQVMSGEILRTVERDAGDPQAAVQELIAAANRAGGKDNVSVVIVEGPQFQARAGNAAPAEPHNNRGRSIAGAALGLILGVLLLGGLQWRFGWPDLHRRPAPPPAARTLLVGSGEGAQFAAINDALSQAKSGDTIELLSGEYREQIRLRDGITLRSRVPHAAIIRTPAESASSESRIAILAENLKTGRVTGLRILADEKMPIQTGIVLADSDIEVDDCEIAGAASGIEIRGNSRPVLCANSIHDSLSSGILISGSSTPWLSHNDIQRNGRKPHDLRPGVLIIGAARPVLVGNVFNENGSVAVAVPEGMDGAPILKFNFFLKGEPLGHAEPGGIGGTPAKRRRRP